MNKSVEIEISNYRLKLALLLLSASDVARGMKVSLQTMYRWQKGITPMTDQQVLALEDLVVNRAHEYWREQWDKKEGSFGHRLKELIIEAIDDAPELVFISRDPRKRTERVENLKERLIELLHGKMRRSKTILETLVEEGYSAAAVQRVAKDIGVKKTVSGFGRNQKSYWSLK
jgi:hypothetical protein